MGNIVNDAIRSAGFTNKQVAYATNMDERSISRICRGEQKPSAEQIELISIYLRNFDLPEQYCATYCPIGKRKNPDGYEAKDLKLIGYMLPRMIAEQEKFLADIQKAFEDGDLTRQEQLMLANTYLPKLYEQIEMMQNIASNLESFKRR